MMMASTAASYRAAIYTIEDEENDPWWTPDFEGAVASDTYDAEDDADAEGRLHDREDSDDDVILELQRRIAEYEAEVHALKAQIESQRTLLRQLQADALMSVTPARVFLNTNIDPFARHEHELKPIDDFPDNPLLVASHAGDAVLVALLLDAGARPDSHGNAALLLACQGGHVKVAEILLACGADVHTDYDSPLLWAAQRGDGPLAALLLEKGASPTALNHCALRMSTRLGHVDVVRELIKAGANPDAIVV